MNKGGLKESKLMVEDSPHSGSIIMVEPSRKGHNPGINKSSSPILNPVVSMGYPKDRWPEAEYLLNHRGPDTSLSEYTLVFSDPQLEADYIRTRLAPRLWSLGWWTTLTLTLFIAAIVLRDMAFYLYSWGPDEECSDLFAPRCRSLGFRIVVAAFSFPAFLLVVALHYLYISRVRTIPDIQDNVNMQQQSRLTPTHMLRPRCCICRGGIPFDVALAVLFASACFIYSRCVNDSNSSLPVDAISVAVFFIFINGMGAAISASFFALILSLICYAGYVACTVGFAWASGRLLYSSDYSSSSSAIAALLALTTSSSHTLSQVDRRYELLWALFWPLASLVITSALSRMAERERRMGYGAEMRCKRLTEKNGILLQQKEDLWKECYEQANQRLTNPKSNEKPSSEREMILYLLRDVLRDADITNDNFIKLKQIITLITNGLSLPDNQSAHTSSRSTLVLPSLSHQSQSLQQQALLQSQMAQLDEETERWVMSLVEASSTVRSLYLPMFSDRQKLQKQHDRQVQLPKGGGENGTGIGNEEGEEKTNNTGARRALLPPIDPNQSQLSSRLPSLLSPAEEQQLQSMVMGTELWDFDLVEVQRVTKNHPLLFVGVALFRKYDLCQKFNISLQKLTNFFKAIGAAYNNIPYHNSTHAADVMRTLHYFINKGCMQSQMTDLEILACLIASAVHDIGHPGINNHFHIAAKHELALLYNDRSVLENYHAAYAFRLIMKAENNILSELTQDEYNEARKLIIDLVLSTDLMHHFDFLGQFKAQVSETPLVDISTTQKPMLLKLALKCADVGHTAKKTDLHLVWVERLTEEFYKQGDQERKRHMIISPFMDRKKPNIPAAQLGFFDFLVIPMYELFISYLCDGPSGSEKQIQNPDVDDIISTNDDNDIDNGAMRTDRRLPCLQRLYTNREYWNKEKQRMEATSQSQQHLQYQHQQQKQQQ